MAAAGLGAADDAARHLAWQISTVLEEGDTQAVRRLFARHGTDLAAQWLRQRGGRQLSRRSRALWRLVLDVEPAPPAALAEALWPL